MRTALLAVGSELLGFDKRDTNGDWLAERIERYGGTVVSRIVSGDDEAVVASTVAAALDVADLVIVTGGLGPTEDDRTRGAIARALGRDLERDLSMEGHLAALFRARGRPFSASQSRQADRPRGASWIENPLGSAPGFLARSRGKLVAALPGVPAEMRAMFAAAVEPILASGPLTGRARRTLKVAGRTESSVDEQMRDLYATEGLEVTILASTGGIELRLATEGATHREAAHLLAEVEKAMRVRLGVDLFGADDDTLASVVGGLLLARGRTLATAESCTGGALGAAVTDVPGASGWYRGGIVCYANDLKSLLAVVPSEMIDRYGAVSEPVAIALAEGARARCVADYGIGVTGIAGPSGGTPEKPVGLVHFAVASASGVASKRVVWGGDRRLVRARSVTASLDLLRRRLIEEGRPA